jgi:hypothetical protein
MKSPPTTPEIFVESAGDLAGAGAMVRDCYEYWRDLSEQAAGQLPRRSMIDPLAIPGMLPNFRLIDLFEDGVLMPRYRLVGTAGRDVMGIDPTGKRFIDIYDETTYAKGIAMYRRIIERRLPLYFVGPILLEGRNFISAERLMLPLGDAKGDVVGLFGVTLPAPAAK